MASFSHLRKMHPAPLSFEVRAGLAGGSESTICRSESPPLFFNRDLQIREPPESEICRSDRSGRNQQATIFIRAQTAGHKSRGRKHISFIYDAFTTCSIGFTYLLGSTCHQLLEAQWCRNGDAICPPWYTPPG